MGIIMTKCLVVGGGGFIGSYVSNLLANAGRDVIALGRSSIFPQRLSNKVKYISGNYGDRLLLRDLLRDTDEVIDLAYATVPKTSFDDLVYDVLSNLPPGVGLIQEASTANLKKIVFVSSGGTVYGSTQTLPIKEDHPTNPISPYGITKLALEKYILMFNSIMGLPAIIVRPSNAYGEYQPAFGGQGFVSTAIKSVILRQPVNIFGQKGTIRDYLYVEDVARGIIAALDFGRLGEVYNIGSGVGLNNMDVVETIAPFAKAYNYPIQINILPERWFDVPANVLDSGKIKSISAWHPEIDFTDGIERTWRMFVEETR